MDSAPWRRVSDGSSRQFSERGTVSRQSSEHDTVSRQSIVSMAWLIMFLRVNLNAIQTNQWVRDNYQ